ncbi:MAG: hypothetical protein HOY79_06025 [Streptomyces sp.]|nr:hypothetical protein [Streptomyces sp.]
MKAEPRPSSGPSSTSSSTSCTSTPRPSLTGASGPVRPEFYELHQGHFRIDAGFFTKQLHVRSDLGTA